MEDTKILEKLKGFYTGNLSTFEDIFKTLNSVIKISGGSIYYANPESLRLEYSYKLKNAASEIRINPTESSALFNTNKDLGKIFQKHTGGICYTSRLTINKTVYGVLLIQREQKLTNQEEVLFDFCGAIISNLIKEIELGKIMKMQTEALQKGITEVEKTNRIIKKQNKKIIAADKIKTKFLSNISHELRTPLNSIIGFSELLLHPKTGQLNLKQEEFIKDIQSESTNLLGMINEILDMTKIESNTVTLNLSEFDINMCITETINILKPLYERKGIKIILNSANTVIKADYLKIRQILFNIISNGIKYSPQEGTIIITTKSTRKNLTISIKDNGCGIEKQYQKRIFKKFEQINPCANSTGLGLTITKELIKLHGGRIKLNSEKDKGAEFIIVLPLSSEQCIAR